MRISIILLLVLTLSGCETYVCGEARKHAAHYEACINSHYCVLSATELGAYKRYKKRLEHRCVGW